MVEHHPRIYLSSFSVCKSEQSRLTQALELTNAEKVADESTDIPTIRRVTVRRAYSDFWERFDGRGE